MLAAVIDGLTTYLPDRAVAYAVGGHTGALLGASLAVLIWLGLSSGTTGQKPGKKAGGIRLLREADGQVLGIWLPVGRRFLHLPDGFTCGIGW